ncbi:MULTISPECIES: MBL fold metallo-hydrolase [Maribacter]|uniref:MBL fold metallo-hydrolase n=1 Tax=Maribacter TaxID=252356 RepID=UPI0008F46099|nr:MULTISPECIES: MBL fold metallo-hydrolase [Maribacter]APA65586.1 beta-lactamase [Maribacter sp. 1_2014MBL_MicDiv]MDP2527833.1 MBL fold metallo-hydrolase [Maribacter dokdonensis]HAF78452.1 MBL fold metallo-hydrolase [Maribacter sp.]|tara:strand:- start:26614 stop:27390 length:777 start_codon:yes stop_codon:yes gene_type:complete
MTNKLSVTFLGTGTSQGIPIIGSTHPVCLSSNEKDKRLRVSVLLSWKEFNYVIDCGPDFRQQMLRQHVNRLDGILYTHEHSDHTAGLDDIRPYFFRQGNIPLFAHSRVVASLKKRFDYIFEEKNKYPGAPTVDINLVKNNEPFSIGDTLVTPINVMHNKVQVFGYRVGDFTYLTDVKTIAPEELEKIKGSKVVVVNALRIEPHISHFNLEEALAFIDLIQPEKAYLTHISHLLGFHDEIEKSLPSNVHLAYDNLTITI